MPNKFEGKTSVVDKFISRTDKPEPPKAHKAQPAHVAHKAHSQPAEEPEDGLRLHVRVTQDVKDYIREASHQRYQTISQYIRSLVEADKATNAKPKSRGKGGK